MKTLTKQEAINLYRKMWNWIADETAKGRIIGVSDYFRTMNIPEDERPVRCLYCCEYVKQNTNAGICDCNSCPIDWGSIHTGMKCLDTALTGEQGLFIQWLLTTDLRQSALLARQIANLPESTDGEI